MNEYEGIYVAVAENYTLDGANTLMNYMYKWHKDDWRHRDYYNVAMRWLSCTVNLGQSGFDFTDDFLRFGRRSGLSEDGCFEPDIIYVL